MAFYKVLEQSFIGLKLCEAGDIVNINDNPAEGGMAPGTNLAACNEEGELKAAKGAKGAKKAVEAEDLA